jgi:threonine dehydrogenase-like Zn-dependent dehydrogenase
MYAMTFVMLSTLLSLEGGLLAERMPTSGLLLAAADTTVEAPARPLSEFTPFELEAERRAVLDSRPSLIPSLLVVGAGAIGFTIGTGILLFATIIVGSVVMGVSTIVVIVGIVLALNIGPARDAAAKRVKEIDAVLDQRRREELRPMPGVPPPGVQLMPLGGLQLASF